jgi:hypothetical protein
MIHPEYIKAFIDSYSGTFRISKFKNEYKFDVCFYSDNIQLLYKIKYRFKNGKIIELFSKRYVLKISKQLEDIIRFFIKNRPLNTKQQILFLRWQYLYTKLIIEKDIIKSDKENRRIKRRLSYFNIAR